MPEEKKQRGVSKEEVRKMIRDELAMLIGYERLFFKKDIILSDGRTIQFGGGTGNKLGTATTQKLAFHNSAPVAQRSGVAQAAVATTGATNSTPYGYTTAAQANAIVTLLNEIRAALVEKGLIKGSA